MRDARGQRDDMGVSTGSEPNPSAGTDHSADIDERDEAPNQERGVRAKGALAVVGVLALLASAVVGSDLFGLRGRVFGSARPEPRPAAVSRQADAPTATTVAPQKTVLRSQPWWQEVTTLTGVGPMTAPAFAISDGAVQWRVKWTCQSGHLTVIAPGRSRPVIDANCPGPETGYGTATGNVSLDVRAEGRWEMHVDQQVDVPLDEPPLPAMAAPGAVRVSSGSFYRIDQTGTGTVTLYHLADGTYAIRLDDFFVTANTELEVKLSALEEPKTSAQFAGAPSALVSPLEVTVGSLNFILPADVDPTKYRSVVIWCRLINSAYTGATLRPVT